MTTSVPCTSEESVEAKAIVDQVNNETAASPESSTPSIAEVSANAEAADQGPIAEVSFQSLTSSHISPWREKLQGTGIASYFKNHPPIEWNLTHYKCAVKFDTKGIDTKGVDKQFSLLKSYVDSLCTIRKKDQSVAPAVERATSLLGEIVSPKAYGVTPVGDSSPLPLATNQRPRAKASTKDKKLQGKGIASYFNNHPPKEWSLNHYKRVVNFDTKWVNKQFSLFQSYVRSLYIIRKKNQKKRSAAERATSLLEDIFNPEAHGVTPLSNPSPLLREGLSFPLGTPEESCYTLGVEHALEGSQADEVPDAVNYLKMFKRSVRALEDRSPQIVADIVRSRHFEGQCTIEPLPGVDELLNKVFGKTLECTWADSLDIVRGLQMDQALNRYLFIVFENYARYFKHSEKIPDHISEREGWANITWPIISSALDIHDIKTRSFEVPVIGNGVTKHFGKKSGKSKILVDGIGFYGSSQLYLAEASKLLKPKPKKEKDDYEKLLRGMGDLAIDHMKKTTATSPLPKTSTVYGSQSYKQQTRFYAMDVATNVPLRQLEMIMVVPLSKQEFPIMMPTCVRAALQFAQIISNETKRRESEGAAAKSMQNTEKSLGPVSSPKAAEKLLDPVSILKAADNEQ